MKGTKKEELTVATVNKASYYLERFNSFVSSPPDKQSKVLRSGSEILSLIDKYFENYLSGKTTRTIQEFYGFLRKELGVTFSLDSLRRYCKEYKPDKLSLYKEARDGKKS